MTGVGPVLRFCPESNDLLYPREDKERKKLVYFCRSCQYQEDADPKEWCVYRNEVQHTSREKSVVLQVRQAPAAAARRDAPASACLSKQLPNAS